MQAHYPKGSYTFTHSPEGGLSFYAPGPSDVDLTTAKEATFGYSVMFEDGFEWQKGGKLPGLCECLTFHLRAYAFVFCFYSLFFCGLSRYFFEARGLDSQRCAGSCAQMIADVAVCIARWSSLNRVARYAELWSTNSHEIDPVLSLY